MDHEQTQQITVDFDTANLVEELVEGYLNNPNIQMADWYRKKVKSFLRDVRGAASFLNDEHYCEAEDQLNKTKVENNEPS